MSKERNYPRGKRETWRAWAEQWRKQRRATGGCASCRRKAAPGRRQCFRCLKKKREYMLEYMRNPKAKLKRQKSRKAWHDGLRKQAIDKYGGQCTCCGETQHEFLTFDHKYNDGASHRKTASSFGATFYLWLIKNKVSKRFQLHCWNCNCAKGIFGFCPHRKVKR
jgi:hypothetical protein